MTGFLSVASRVFPRTDYRMWNVFVIVGLWLHLLFVCLSGDLARNYFCGFQNVFAWDIFFFFVKSVFKVKMLNFKWVHGYFLTVAKNSFVAVRCALFQSAQEVPHFTYHYVSVLSSQSASSNVSMCLPVFDLFVVHRDKWSWTDVQWRPPSVIAARLICYRIKVAISVFWLET